MTRCSKPQRQPRKATDAKLEFSACPKDRSDRLININKPASGGEEMSNPGAHLRFKANP